jgi:hypothetical protein
MTKVAILSVYKRILKQAIRTRWGGYCALLSFFCALGFAIAQNPAENSAIRIVYTDIVSQADANPRTITLPVVDGRDIRFTRLSTEEGLSQTRVDQVVQDNQGFMWFGTQYGLDRYDGYKFKVFTHEPGRTDSLSGVDVSSLFKTVRARSGLDVKNTWTNSIQLPRRLLITAFKPMTREEKHFPSPTLARINRGFCGYQPAKGYFA